MTNQSNTQVGLLPILSSEDLTGKENYLVALASGGLALPNAITDRVPYVVEDGKASGEYSDVLPFEPSRNFRIKAKGTGTRGDVLVLAAIAGGDDGKVRALPAGAGTYHGIAIAEETFVDGQLVLCRPISREAIVVS